LKAIDPNPGHDRCMIGKASIKSPRSRQGYTGKSGTDNNKAYTIAQLKKTTRKQWSTKIRAAEHGDIYIAELFTEENLSRVM